MMKELIKKYQEFTKTTAIYPGAEIKFGKQALDYLSLALEDEHGELCGKLKKLLRDHSNNLTQEYLGEIVKECGDVVYYLSQLCNTIGLDLYDYIKEESYDEYDESQNVIARRIGYNINGMAKSIDDYLDDTLDEKLLSSEIRVNLYPTLFYIQLFLANYGYTLETVIRENMAKLQSRKDRGVISGSGDNR